MRLWHLQFLMIVLSLGVYGVAANWKPIHIGKPPSIDVRHACANLGVRSPMDDGFCGRK